MLIMHVIPGDLWAGAESQVYYTIRELIRQSDHEFVVVLFNKKELYKRLCYENVTIHIINEEINNSLIICFRIKNLIKAISPNIVHVHEYKGHILTFFGKLMARGQCKLIRTLHGLTSVPFAIKYIKTFMALRLEKILLQHLTDCNIAVSKDIESMSHKEYKHTRVCQINNAVRIPSEIDINSTGTRKRFDVGINTLWIGTASRLVSVKNLGMLIDAANILKEKTIEDFKVSIFGEGHLQKTLQQKIEEDGLTNYVHLHGHYNNFLPIIKSFDIFVLTSLHEGLPMSLLEAMSVGTVPICAEVGGMKEVIKNSKNGFLVKSGSAAELAEVLALLYENEDMRRTIGNNAEKRVQEEYSIENNVKNLLHLYESL